MSAWTCANCKHFNGARDAATVGTCNLGGPDASQGCSDVRGDETCEKYEPVGEEPRS